MTAPSQSYNEANHPFLRAITNFVTLYLRDDPELNRLTSGREHSPHHIRWAVFDTLSDWASTPPFMVVDLETLQTRGWHHVFLRGVVIALLESLLFLHMRNHLAYSDGGVNVQTEDPRIVQAVLDTMRPIYEHKKQRILVALNVEEILDGGGVHSELAWVNNYLSV